MASHTKGKQQLKTQPEQIDIYSSDFRGTLTSDLSIINQGALIIKQSTMSRSLVLYCVYGGGFITCVTTALCHSTASDEIQQQTQDCICAFQ